MKQSGMYGWIIRLTARQSLSLSFCALMSGLCLVLVLSGCLSVPNSPTPRFYMLQAACKNQVSEETKMDAEILIGVGPVNIPEYQDRPQIVTQGKEKMLKFAQFDRWGESLDFGVARLIREELAVMLPGAKCILYPWNSTMVVKYQVVVEIVQLDSELDKDLCFAAQWLVIDVKNEKTMMIKRSEFREAIFPQNYSGLVKTLSAICVSLSGEIAEALGTLEKTKEETCVSKE